LRIEKIDTSAGFDGMDLEKKNKDAGQMGHITS